MADVVLVHGAWHGSWCWDEVAERLRAAGHRVVAPTLTGLAERRHLLGPEVTLDTHIADVARAVRGEAPDDGEALGDGEAMGRVVLVAHSYGGMPGVGAADQLAQRCDALVLLDAFLPLDGWSSNELRERSRPARPLDLTDPVAIAPPDASAFGLSGQQRDRVNALLTPHPRATTTQAIRLSGAFEEIGVKHYHRATRYAAGYFDDAAAHAVAQGTWHVEYHDLDHDMMLTDPEWTVAAISDAIAAVSRS